MNSFSAERVRDGDLLRWLRRVRSSGSGRILGAVAIIGMLTVAVKAVSFARDLIIAAELGMGDVLDAYIIASTIPMLVVNVITGSLMRL